MSALTDTIDRAMSTRFFRSGKFDAWKDELTADVVRTIKQITAR